jgi:hypothetical protein
MTTIWIEGGDHLSPEERDRLIADAASKLELMNFSFQSAEPHTPDECTLHRGGLLVCGHCEHWRRRKAQAAKQ